MIVMIEVHSLKKMCEFISAGITSEAETFWVSISVCDGIDFIVNGTAMYICSSECRVLKKGESWVSSRVLCELVQKIKCKPDVLITLGCFEQNKLTVRGPGFEYCLPTSERIHSCDWLKSSVATVNVRARHLLEVATNMKVIREAESDCDVPVCEIRASDRVQFTAITRLRSVSTWVEIVGSKVEQEVCLFVAIEHLQKMDKAIKQAVKDDSDSIVRVNIFTNQVGFTIGHWSILLRRVERKPSQIHELIAFCRDPKNIRARIRVDGKLLKEAYDRLDAFGKRNQSSIHRIDFHLNGSNLKMRAFSSNVGEGYERITVEACGDSQIDNVEFAAAGNKLSELLRISGYQTVIMEVGSRNIVMSWANDGVANLAILAGLATERSQQ